MKILVDTNIILDVLLKREPHIKAAQIIISQYGGPDGEIGASMRYLSQRYSMENRKAIGTLTDIGREAPEMFHLRGCRFF